MFWQGGFTFYTAIVVPLGTEVLKSARRQGFITRRVTRSINVTGAVALLPLAWDALLGRDPRARRRWLRALLCLAMLLAQLALFYLHPAMDRYLQVKGGIVLDAEAFHPLHRMYLWVSTLLWGLAVAFTILTVFAWRAEDRSEGATLADGNAPR
jgi:hypothetical protein